MAFKETYEVCALLEGASRAIEQVRADNQLGFNDLFALSPLVDLGKNAITDVTGVVSEFKEASGEELDEAISRIIKANLDFAREVSALFKMLVKQ